MNLTPRQEKARTDLDADRFDDPRARAEASRIVACRACIFCSGRPCQGCDDPEDGYCDGHGYCEHFPMTTPYMIPDEDPETWAAMLMSAGLTTTCQEQP